MKALFKVLPVLALIGAAPAPGITIGTVLDDSLGKTVRGWLHASGSMYDVFERNGNVIKIKSDCCIAILTKGNSYIIAQTVPLKRLPNGGVIKEKIIDLRRIDLRPGEEGMACNLYGLQIVFSVLNPKTRMARSVVVDGKKLSLLEWKDSERRCFIEGD